MNHFESVFHLQFELLIQFTSNSMLGQGSVVAQAEIKLDIGAQ
jgi:hypothetical protein